MAVERPLYAIGTPAIGLLKEITQDVAGRLEERRQNYRQAPAS